MNRITSLHLLRASSRLRFALNTLASRFTSLSFPARAGLAAVIGLATVTIVATMISSAATPPSGTLSLATPNLSYVGGGPYVVPNASAQANGTPICNAALPCDDYTLTINVPPGTDATKRVRISVGWPVSTADFDVYVLDGATGENVTTTSASSLDPEVCFLPAISATYRIRTVPFVPAGQNYTATVSLEDTPTVPPPATGIAPRYQNYPPNPVGLSGADSAGEPSIGIDWNINCPAATTGCQNLHPNAQFPKRNTGGLAFFTANLNEYRVTFDDCSSPAKQLWEDVTFDTESLQSLDPIGFVDPHTGRVFQSQLAGATSIMAFSDDDGQTWTQSQGSGQPAGVDHQTVGGGPFNETTIVPPVHPLYPNQVYYASQDIATALAARSNDGGLTFGPGVPVWSIADCGGLHGHVKVGPDGTVYIPNKGCGGQQGVAVSTDNGLTWIVRKVPGSTPEDTDPAVAIGSDNTLYFGYINGDGHPHMAASGDHGVTWTDRDVSAGVIKNAVFAQATAGDGDRAAIGFVGTTAAGNYQDINNFKGVWGFYIATTFDRGLTYSLVNATGDDPVQIGSICTSGTTCGADRNLLDFNDIQVDKEGRVLAAYADGCVAPNCTAATANGPAPFSASRSARASIIRQSGGRRLFAAFDPTEPGVPAAPRVDNVSQSSPGTTVHLEWSEPDNGGSPLTGYKVYRKSGVGGTYNLLATITLGCPACKTTYDDATATNTTIQYFYKVTASNAIGEGTNCGDFPVGDSSTPTDETACEVPGLTKLEDPAGDTSAAAGIITTPAPPGSDLLSFQIAQPFQQDGVVKLVFTINTDPGQSPQPIGSSWYVAMQTPAGSCAAAPCYKGVHMAWTATSPTTPTFESYVPAPNNSGGVDGRLVTPGSQKPAEATSSYNAPFNKVVIVVRASDLGLNPGDLINGFVSGVSQSTDPGGIIGVGATALYDQMPDSLNFSGTYTVGNNQTCAPNTCPVAVLSATTPTSGNAPLTVGFTGASSSDSDPGDTIASYTFNYGDGSPLVTQASPTTSHTYTSGGDFAATLRVTDSRGLISCSTSLVVVSVNGSSGTPTPTPTPTPTAVQFSATSFAVTEGVTSVNLTVTRTGSTASVSTVDYLVNNSTATQRGDFTYASGTVVFNVGDTSKTFTVLISEDGYFEGSESALVTLSNPTGAIIGSPGTTTLQINDNETADAATNPIDDAATFVGMHYHDFLNRQADPSGQAFWTNELTSCGPDASCLDEKHTNVSAAFFLSVEFQNTGYFAFRFYRASFPDNMQRPRGVPRYLEFLRDEQKLQNGVVVGQPNWEAFLEQNKQGFALDWVDRADFIAEYPTTMTRDEYIDKLFSRSGVTPTAQERTQAQQAYDSGFSVKEKRAKGIRAAIDTGSIYNAQYNPAFVLMQYFGYLRRNPDNAPDNNFSGYDFWLNKMNQFSLPGEDMRDGNVALARVKRAEMVKAFLVSGEYRGRFGGDASRGGQAGSIAHAKPSVSWTSETMARVARVVFETMRGI
ncbi:MAG TPA: Calx-beta domain-containing protein [Pyrinomonadaceae bacterium]